MMELEIFYSLPRSMSAEINSKTYQESFRLNIDQGVDEICPSVTTAAEDLLYVA